MPSQEVLNNAVSMLQGRHAGDMTNVTGDHTQDVLAHLQDLATRPANQLPSPVRRAARGANNNPEQLINNLLALVIDDAHKALLHNAMDMVTGMHKTDLTAVTGLNTQNVTNHLHDIYEHQQGRGQLDSRVAEAQAQAGGNPENLVLNLLDLVTAAEVLSPRTGWTVQPPTLPSPEVIGDAVMLVARGTGMPQATERNRTDVAGHLRDIAALPFPTLNAGVRQAAQRWHDNPEQLAQSLLTLVTATPPVLPSQPSASPPPANQTDEAGTSNAPRPNRPAQLARSNARRYDPSVLTGE